MQSYLKIVQFFFLCVLCLESKAIINGEPLDLERFPNVVALTLDSEIICSGVLLDKRIVITAGHCIEQISSKSKSRMGVYRGQGIEGGQVEPQFSVSSFSIHAKYLKERNLNSLSEFDYAVITLNEDAPYKEELIYFDKLDDGSELIISGFGSTESGYEDSQHSAHDTGLAFMGQSQVTRSGNSEFIAQDAESSTCFMDSGGPVYVEQNGQTALVGIASRGDGQCRSLSIFGYIGKSGLVE